MKTQHTIQAICFDFGDTLIDEGSEIKDEHGITLEAALIPGAAETVLALKDRGYTLCLVADGYWDSYTNVLGHHGLWDLFDAYAVSERVGVDKPDPRMFIHAMQQIGVEKTGYGCVVMVGNNLERDIKGGNMLGMVSVWLDWAPRRSKVPADEWEQPDYMIKQPLELLTVIDRLEA